MTMKSFSFDFLKKQEDMVENAVKWDGWLTIRTNKVKKTIMKGYKISFDVYWTKTMSNPEIRYRQKAYWRIKKAAFRRNDDDSMSHEPPVTYYAVVLLDLKISWWFSASLNFKALWHRYVKYQT